MTTYNMLVGQTMKINAAQQFNNGVVPFNIDQKEPPQTVPVVWTSNHHNLLEFSNGSYDGTQITLNALAVGTVTVTATFTNADASTTVETFTVVITAPTAATPVGVAVQTELPPPFQVEAVPPGGTSR